jgi:predicted unusual protein kinase regulating ubiquinone biosynthesis (AarF/ABC1/UbiB family)
VNNPGSQLRRRIAETLRSSYRLCVIVWAATRIAVAVSYDVVAHRARPSDALARRLAPTLSRLGTASIKLGQLIASSPGTFPAALVRACSELRDNIETDNELDIEAVLAAELGDGARRFRSVAVTPIAAASIAQVHLGQLDSGRVVAIKVQRPGVAGVLATDLRLLTSLARVSARAFPGLRRMDIAGLMGALGDQLLSELDFTAERKNAGLLRSALLGTGIVVPRCVEELCTARVLVMDYLPGRPLSASSSRTAAAGSGPVVARRVLQALLAPLSTHGVFHADMHGGNLIIGTDGTLGMVDFGSVTQLDSVATQSLNCALLALFERRFQEAACALLSLMDVTNADLTAAQAELAAVTSTYLDRSIEDLPVGLVIRQLIGIGTSHGIVMPAALLSFMRQMLFLDGIARELDATFNFLDEGAAIMRAELAGAAALSPTAIRPVLAGGQPAPCHKPTGTKQPAPCHKPKGTKQPAPCHKPKGTKQPAPCFVRRPPHSVVAFVCTGRLRPLPIREKEESKRSQFSSYASAETSRRNYALCHQEFTQTPS